MKVERLQGGGAGGRSQDRTADSYRVKACQDGGPEATQGSESAELFGEELDPLVASSSAPGAIGSILEPSCGALRRLGLGRAPALLLALALAAPLPAAAQDDDDPHFDSRYCPGSTWERPIWAKTKEVKASWHTTLGGGTSQPRLWQVGVEREPGEPELLWTALAQFKLPQIRGRNVVGIDLITQTRDMPGVEQVGVLEASVWLLGPDGLGDHRRKPAAELEQSVSAGVPLSGEYYDTEDPRTLVLWVDELMPFALPAMAAREPWISLALVPNPSPGPSHRVRLRQVWLRFHHCAADAR